MFDGKHFGHIRLHSTHGFIDTTILNPLIVFRLLDSTIKPFLMKPLPLSVYLGHIQFIL